MPAMDDYDRSIMDLILVVWGAVELGLGDDVLLPCK